MFQSMTVSQYDHVVPYTGLGGRGYSGVKRLFCSTLKISQMIISHNILIMKTQMLHWDHLCSCCNLTTMMTSSKTLFPRYWPFARGILRSPVNSPYKGQWRGALMLSLISAWANGSSSSRYAGDLRRHHAHHDVTVMNNGMHFTSTPSFPLFFSHTSNKHISIIMNHNLHFCWTVSLSWWLKQPFLVLLGIKTCICITILISQSYPLNLM